MLEQLYTDFTTKMLPTIQEGLSITKDYFMDLFGRYIHYLILRDSIAMFVFFLMAVIPLIKMKKFWDYLDEYEKPGILVLVIPCAIGIVGFFINLDYLVKDIYIPEVRVYQELNLKLQK